MMHPENFCLYQIQSGRLSAIINFYLVNRAKWLYHYYKTKCEVSMVDAP